MPKQFELRMEAERFIHNDLAQATARLFDAVEAKHIAKDTAGVYYDEMACIIFCAFTVEAQVNFVGWKVLEEGWPERASLEEKINLLIKVIPLKLDWKERPLKSIGKLKDVRNKVAHGKPEPYKKTVVVNTDDPDIWQMLKGSWTKPISRKNMKMFYEDMEAFWQHMLEKAEISFYETITHGSHSLSLIKGPAD